MCDYSMHAYESRAAKVGDKLEVTSFPAGLTRGLADPADPKVAVCLCEGTEIAFDKPADARVHVALGLFMPRTFGTVAKFVKINTDNLLTHHDALEFPDGQRVLLSELLTGQRAHVLQIPPVESAHLDGWPQHVIDADAEAMSPAMPLVRTEKT